MQLAELKSAVDALPDGDRLALEAYLKMKNLIASESYRMEMVRRLRETESGGALSSTDVRDIHETLARRGL